MSDEPTLPPGWLPRVVNLLNEMACEGIGMGDCADPADLMVEIAEHLGFGNHEDPWASVTVWLNGLAPASDHRQPSKPPA